MVGVVTVRAAFMRRKTSIRKKIQSFLNKIAKRIPILKVNVREAK